VSLSRASHLTNTLSIPTNLQFEIDDAEDEWIFPQKFDYIHGRTLATCFKDPPSIFGKAFDALVPGGYFELQDMSLQTSDDGSMDGTALLEWQTHVKEAATKTGVEWTNVPNYKRWMIEGGFEDVTEVNFRWPSNQWSSVRKERLLGAWTQAQIDNGMLESVSTRLFIMKLGWSKERLDEFLARVNRDTKDPRIKAYSPM
jgi:Methyltransferase domain